MKSAWLATVFATILSGCSGGGGDVETPFVELSTEGALTGRFIDVAPVTGLRFSTPTQSGMTDDQGNFTYEAGEQVVFSLGGIELPATAATPVVTSASVFSTEDILLTSVVNLNRLLMSLDTDGILDNGIQISDMAHSAATGLQLNFSSGLFDDLVINLVANAQSVRTSLIDRPAAITAYVNSLEQHSIRTSDCDSTHSQVGTTADFEMFFHDVSGTMRVLDDCTLEISNFTYDGEGPAVYFYTGNSRTYVGSNVYYVPFLLTGNTFENDRIRLHLPEGITLDDFDSLSVWCFDFRINFGDAFWGV